MNATLKTSKKQHKLTLTGEVNFAEVNTLWECAQQIAQDPKPTQVDWANLNSLHFAGIQVLFALQKTLEEQGIRLTFGEPNPAFYQILHQFGVWDSLIQN
ncbi:MAG: STAS domain-containing protein [Fimbriimonadales bacterium]